MLDVRITRYVIPLAEQVLDDITPSIEVRNYADEDATITGLVKIYRQSTDTLEYTSELATTELPRGTTATIPALSAWSPGAPADDDYFVLAEILATSYLPGPPIRSSIGAWKFDVKPGPMGPAPAAHHTTHEDGGMDELDLTGLSGILGDIQPVDTHATSHQKGEPDAIEISNLGTSELDDTLVLCPDGAGGVHWTTAPGGTINWNDYTYFLTAEPTPPEGASNLGTSAVIQFGVGVLTIKQGEEVIFVGYWTASP